MLFEFEERQWGGLPPNVWRIAGLAVLILLVIWLWWYLEFVPHTPRNNAPPVPQDVLRALAPTGASTSAQIPANVRAELQAQAGGKAPAPKPPPEVIQALTPHD